MQYCGYCVKILNRTNLWKHCLTDHDKKTCALAAGDTPPDPFCLNWPEYIKDPSNTVPELKVGIFNKSFDPKSNFINNDSSSDKSEDDEEEKMPNAKPEANHQPIKKQNTTVQSRA